MPSRQNKKRTQGVAWMAWLRQKDFLLLDCRGKGEDRDAEKGSLVTFLLPPSLRLSEGPRVLKRASIKEGWNIIFGILDLSHNPHLGLMMNQSSKIHIVSLLHVHLLSD